MRQLHYRTKSRISAGISPNTSSMATSASSQTIEDNALKFRLQVEKIESEFIRGEFFESLLQANRFLIENKNNSEENDTRNNEKFIPLDNPITLALETVSRHHERIFAIRLSIDNTTVFDNFSSRVAAIALQSWYEISKRFISAESFQSSYSNIEHHLETGIQHLYPVLDFYSTKLENIQSYPTAGMGVALFLLFIQFVFNALHDTKAALNLSSSFLYLLRKESKFIDTIQLMNERQQDEVREFVFYVFDFLIPKCALYDPLAVNFFLNDFESESGKCPVYKPIFQLPSKIFDDATESQTKTAIQTSLKFCNTKESLFVEWLDGTFCDCRKSLSTKLQRIRPNKIKIAKTDATILTNCSESVRTNSNKLDIGSNNISVGDLPLLRWIKWCKLWVANFWIQSMPSSSTFSLREIIAQSSEFRYSGNAVLKTNTVRVLVCLIVLRLGWKQRSQVVARLKKSMLVLVWKELVNIIDAIGLRK
jgi:hypothetical protein